MKVKVIPIRTATGGIAKEQYLIKTKEGFYFQSYSFVIAFCPIEGTKFQLDQEYWKDSRISSKYRNRFLNENKAETQRKVDSGEYELTSLN